MESVTPKVTLFVKNLSDEVEEEDLESLLTKVVPESLPLVSIRLIRNEDGVKRGIAFIDVSTQEKAEKCLKLNNYNLKGKMI